MAKKTSKSLGDHFEKFIASSVANGRFKNADEVVRAALRLLEDEENRVTALRNALIKGEESRRAVNFDPKAHLAVLHKKYV